MLKKAVVFGSLLSSLLVNSAWAEAPNFQSGFLVGGDVGYSYGSGTFNANFKDGTPFVSPVVSGSASSSAGLVGVIGGYRFIFNQGSTFGVDVSANYLAGNEIKKRFNQTGSLFDNRLERDFNVVPSFSFGKIIYDQFHIALGLGLGITQFKHRVDNLEASVSVSSSQTKLGFVPSVGAEYAYTKHISFIGNVSYEMYRKVNSNFGQNVAPGVRGSGYWSAIKPKFLTPKAGIVYRF
jgi:hypothetical protein